MPVDPLTDINTGVPLLSASQTTAVADVKRSDSSSASGNIGISGSLLSVVTKTRGVERFERLNKVLTFDEYITAIENNPKLIRTSAQRIVDMIMEKGRTPITVDGKQIYEYNFFKNPINPGDAISGNEIAIHEFVTELSRAAKEDRRAVLLVGPVGTAKTTVVRAIAAGLEKYSESNEGELYALSWDLSGLKSAPGFEHIEEHKDCEMFEDPLNVLDLDTRKEITDILNDRRRTEYQGRSEVLPYTYSSTKKLCPCCTDIKNKLIAHYRGDESQVRKHIKVKTLALNSSERKGITFFGAKDEKTHDANELSGSVNWKKMLETGSTSNPQALVIDGAVLRGNRGLIHFGEMLKLPKEITYPLLDATEDRNIMVGKSSLVDFDGVIIGTTNIPDYRKVLRDDSQEAIRSRIVAVMWPYVDNVDKEVGIYTKGFSKLARELGIHEAPHGLYVAALWALATRLDEPTGGLDILQKALLYSGRHITGFTETSVLEMKRDAGKHGKELLGGISPRDVQNALSRAIDHPDVSDPKKGTRCVDPFIIIDMLEHKLDTTISAISEEDKTRFKAILKKVEAELGRKLLDDVRRAAAGDDSAAENLFNAYVAHVRAFVKNEKVKDQVTKQDVAPDEKNVMRPIEEKMNIADGRKEEHRRFLMAMVGDKALAGESYTYKTDERLKRAIEEVLLERHKQVALPTLGTPETASNKQKEVFETVKNKLISDFDYCPHCAQIAMRHSNSPHQQK